MMNGIYVTYNYLAEELKEFLDAFELKLAHNQVKFDRAQRYDEAEQIKELDERLKDLIEKLEKETAN